MIDYLFSEEIQTALSVVLTISCVVVVIFLICQRNKTLKKSKKLKKGLSRNQVLEIMGEPYVVEPNKMLWLISSVEFSRGTICRVLEVIFENNIVISFKKVAKPKVDLKSIKSVSIVATRTGQESRLVASCDYSVYSLLVKYVDGTQEVIECKKNSEEFEKYMSYLDRGENNG